MIGYGNFNYALRLPCEHATFELPSHLVISPTTVHLKPNPDRSPHNLKKTCFINIYHEHHLTRRVLYT